MKNPDHEKQTRGDEFDASVDAASVSQAAAQLGVGERRVFEIAYEHWYGETGDGKTIGDHFATYTATGDVPLWMYHFCRKVIKLERDGSLDPADFGIVSASATIAQRNYYLEFIAAAVFLVIAFVFIGETAIGLLFIIGYFSAFYYLLYLALYNKD